LHKSQNVAVVFGGGINGLGIIRNLGRIGIDVYCVIDRIDEAIFSRYCKKSFIVPNIQTDVHVLKSFLNNFKSTFREHAVIYSTTDLFSLNIAKLKDDIKDNYRVLLPELKVTETLVNKESFYRSLSDSNILYPKTYFPDSLKGARRLAKRISYPVFIRPAISQAFTRKYSEKGFVASSPREALCYFNLAFRDKIDVMFQEIIPGSNENIFGICGFFGKEFSVLFAYNRLRGWPLYFGNTSLMKSIPLSDVSPIDEKLKSYLEELRYYGLMEAEFKFDLRDKEFKILEINARSWWQNSFPAKCGINLVLIAYLEALGYNMGKINDHYHAGKKWIHFPADLLSLIGSGKIGVRSWLSSFKGIKDYAFFSGHDLMPCVASYIINARSFLKSSQKVNINLKNID
jgi:D-aspartate ligase